MLSRAIVESIVDKYHVRIRIPMYNLIAGAADATPTDQLYIAPICTPPGNYPALVVGDVVFVSFEDDEVSQPVIIGCLYRKEGVNSLTDIHTNSLTVDVNSKLSSATTIGQTTATDLKNASGTYGNLQAQINALEERIKQLEEQ